ncbi:toxin-activating lysine-acyltransferase [Reyranella sp. CPCC 100927]|uniref:toxin-activating lysine-acyltransferase n=1 Tax=Reyranella sp. CPCC 100927 TaxID=2599616 RepID=UPI0015B51C7B|nr:toxin-activating lysine-acyltransferase [Reyranella sp. CPCC 100927]
MTSAGTNGSVGQRSTLASATDSPKGASRNVFAESFAQVVAVLMRDKGFRNATLADLEWLVIPPLVVRQYGVAHAAVPASRVGEAGTSASRLMPVAVVLWARVSDRLDKTLSDTQTEAPKLRPADWTSGENVWIMAAAGDRRAIPTFLDQLAAKDFKDRLVKMRVRGKDGKVTIRTYGGAAPS